MAPTIFKELFIAWW